MRKTLHAYTAPNAICNSTPAIAMIHRLEVLVISSHLGYVVGSERECGGEIVLVANVVQQCLVSIVRQESPPFQGKGYVRREEVHDVAHVGLVLGTAAGDEIAKVRGIDSVRGIALPFFRKVDLRLHPPAARTDAPVS